jgi:hypothetical protein
MSSVDSYSPPEHSSNRSSNNSTKDNGCSAACEAHRLINSTHNSSSSALPLFHIHGIMSSRSRSLLHTLGHHHAPLILVLQLLAATGWPRDQEGLPTQHVSNGRNRYNDEGLRLEGHATVHRHGLLHCKHDRRHLQPLLPCLRRHCGAAHCTHTSRERERERVEERDKKATTSCKQAQKVSCVFS